MDHIIYKISTGSGKYYIGRHSTNNIHDAYIGSGKWPSGLIKAGKIVCKEILCKVETYEELIELEDLVIKTCIHENSCMNFNENSIGFSSTHNPSKTEERRKEISENSWSKTEFGRKFLSENNPSKKKEVKEKRREQAKKQLQDGSHNFLNPDLQKQKSERFKLMLIENNPNNNPQNRINTSKRNRKLLEDGIHPFQDEEMRNRLNESNSNRVRKLFNEGSHHFQTEEFREMLKAPKPIVTCPHCGKSGAGPSMWRYHHDKCKSKEK